MENIPGVHSPKRSLVHQIGARLETFWRNVSDSLSEARRSGSLFQPRDDPSSGVDPQHGSAYQILLPQEGNLFGFIPLSSC